MYNPGQPRVPAGDRYGGRWTGTGMGGGPAGGPQDGLHRPRPPGTQVAGHGTALPGAQNLGPFSPAMAPYLHGLLSRLISDAVGRMRFLGGLLVAAVDEISATYGELPDHPDIRYRYKAGVLTVWQDAPGDNKPLLYHGPAGADGLYRLPDGTIIGRDLPSGVFLNEIAIILQGQKVRAVSSARAGEAANDDIKLCPDPVDDRPSTKAMSDRAKLYQQQITKLPIGQAISLNGVMFDGCRTIDGVMLEAKGEGFIWAFKNGELYYDHEGIREMVGQMYEQSATAAKANKAVEWHVAEKPLADYLANIAAGLPIRNVSVTNTLPIYPNKGAK